MKRKNKVLVRLGFLLISVTLCSSALAKNKKPKKNIENIQAEHLAINDPNVIRHADTKTVYLKSKNAIIIDYDTNKILLEKNAYARIIPASMTKIMTSYLIEEKLKNGEVSNDLLLLVSEKAWRMQGSKTFVPLGEEVRLEDLLKGIIIQSGNDASIVAAEGLYGSEENFVDAMNDMINKMGLKDTHFDNASGWPSPTHYSTVYDLAQLGRRLIKDHPEYYSIYSEKTFTFGKDSKNIPITQGNRNPLLYKDLGCDGIKSGHTDEGGYSLLLSFISNERRYIAVINGLKSAKERSDEADSVLAWVKENFVNKKLYSKGDIIEDKAPVDSGVKETVQLITNQDTYIFLPCLNPVFKSEKIFKNPLEAPVKAGECVGKIKITYGNTEFDIPVIANENIEKIGMFKKLYRKIIP
jgi:D-alanyl-D-alanine carboxypeptidase (penicillin-binding protein 5/6)